MEDSWVHGSKGIDRGFGWKMVGSTSEMVLCMKSQRFCLEVGWGHSRNSSMDSQRFWLEDGSMDSQRWFYM